MRPVLGLASAGALVACVAGWQMHRGDPPAPLKPGATPVVVELFSSEGCRSCPPADQYLATLDRTQSVDGVAALVLEEHVDYWDDLGWADPFAQAQFDTRQRQYAGALPDHRVYTPEIVIDGHALVEHGDEEQAARDMQASAAEERAHVSVSRDGDRVEVDVRDAPPPSGQGVAQEVWLAVTESGLQSEVASGENAGRRLAHAPIVRALRRLGVVEGGAFRTEAPLDARFSWKPRALRVVVFVQDAATRGIVGAGAG
jgi:hypothetical protein